MEDYKTNDLYLAIHLICCGVRLKNILRINPKRAELIFEKPSEEILNGYFEETQKFSTRKVLMEMKSLKTRIYNSPLS